MGTPFQHQGPDPLKVICPLCGALPGERCSLPGRPEGRSQAHDSRRGEAIRQAILSAPPTEDVGRWATLEERAGR